MNQSNNKKIIFGVLSIGALILAGIYIKKRNDENRYKPISREKIIQILKRTQKQNYTLYKIVSDHAIQIIKQMNTTQIDTQTIKNYMERPESPLKINETFEKNYRKNCDALGVPYEQFQQSLEHYVQIDKDDEIRGFHQQFQRDYETSLSGKMPQFKVNVPSSLSKQKLIQIIKKLVQKKYLLQIQFLRMVKGKTQRQIKADLQLLKSLSNPEDEFQKLLEQHGLGTAYEPATAVYNAALFNFRNDPQIKIAKQSAETLYQRIYKNYKPRIQKERLSLDQLTQLEDQLVYYQAI